THAISSSTPTSAESTPPCLTAGWAATVRRSWARRGTTSRGWSSGPETERLKEWGLAQQDAVPVPILLDALLPAAVGLLLPQPDDPVHVLRLAAQVLEPGHQLTAMVLGVHGYLHERLGDGDVTGRVWKPGDAHDLR